VYGRLPRTTKRSELFKDPEDNQSKTTVTLLLKPFACFRFVCAFAAALLLHAILLRTEGIESKQTNKQTNNLNTLTLVEEPTLFSGDYVR